jgi:hypothetical protein
MSVGCLWLAMGLCLILVEKPEVAVAPEELLEGLCLQEEVAHFSDPEVAV